MLREAQIPFLLWLPAALVFHLVTGSSAVQVATVMSERADILAFSRAVRHDVREGLLMTVEWGTEVAHSDDQPPEPPEPEDDPTAEPSVDEQDDEPREAEPKPLVQRAKPAPKKKMPEPAKLAPKPKPKPKKVAVKEPTKKETPKPKPKPKKPTEKKPAKKQPVAKLELPRPDGRIAVINDPSLRKDEQDNPNAHRIADHARRVKQETMARFRSYDQNTPKPTGGGMPTPLPMKQAGNAHDSKRGFSNQVEGDDAPKSGSEKGGPESEPIARSQQGSNQPPPGQQAIKAQKGLAARPEQTGPSTAEVVTADSGASGGAAAWSISADAKGDGKIKRAGRKGRKAIAGRAATPGVPMPGALPARYSINAYGLVAALGRQHMRREQEKARNTRLARHRGSFKANEFQKYRAAIENYDPSVKPGNQTSLNAARVPFASYINKMHNRIHPIFAGGFLGSLGKLSYDDKLSNMSLSAHMELVLDSASGKVIRAGIVRGSGVTAFDVAALSSVKSAGAFGVAPDAIISPDGNVYVHWEFYRDPYYACTSKFARPYLIKSSPDDDRPPPGPRRPPAANGEERRTAQGAPLRPERKQ